MVEFAMIPKKAVIVPARALAWVSHLSADPAWRSAWHVEIPRWNPRTILILILEYLRDLASSQLPFPPFTSTQTANMSVNIKYPNDVKIVHSDKEGGSFTSKLVVLKTKSAGDVIAPMEGITEAVKRWSSVQISADTHIELNSELVYMNHSCDPSVYIDVTKRQVIAAKDLQPEDELTFFYPSTEWDMSQAFDCWCGAQKCIKRVQGARHLSEDVLSHQFINSHIQKLLSEQTSTDSSPSQKVPFVSAVLAQ
ncbi:hypothetical protein DFS34DRAFT_599497 [Phlyctochytrium arcticum]|nr:hypothetical protein DFS34DRAFT_599497 [Phlyctochytrium arcticum]